jgi:hypothetical protein
MGDLLRVSDSVDYPLYRYVGADPLKLYLPFSEQFSKEMFTRAQLENGLQQMLERGRVKDEFVREVRGDPRYARMPENVATVIATAIRLSAGVDICHFTFQACQLSTCRFASAPELVHGFVTHSQFEPLSGAFIHLQQVFDVFNHLVVQRQTTVEEATVVLRQAHASNLALDLSEVMHVCEQMLEARKRVLDEGILAQSNVLEELLRQHAPPVQA